MAPAPILPMMDSQRAIMDILAERTRQIAVEGWTPEHDDDHVDGALANAAACYAYGEIIDTQTGYHLWPWSDDWWKPKDRRTDLVRAAALLIAEIQRLDRRARSALDAYGGEAA